MPTANFVHFLPALGPRIIRSLLHRPVTAAAPAGRTTSTGTGLWSHSEPHAIARVLTCWQVTLPPAYPDILNMQMSLQGWLKLNIFIYFCFIGLNLVHVILQVQ